MNPESTQHSVLLLDDDKFLLDMYGMKFGREGFVVQTCFSTHDALNVLRQGFVPDVILFDLVMPGEDGFAFLQTLRKERLAEHAIKIALTNQSSDPEKAKATELGADKFIVKATMIPSEVVQTVRDTISAKKSA
ncbi:MAG TPA: response regulator [Candidatus Paceibacterota bacterium]